MKKFLFALILAYSVSHVVYAQPKNNIEDILPMTDVDQTQEKLQVTTTNMEMMVHADVNGSLVNYDNCSRTDRNQGGLKIQIDWYNTNDETGKMMADMVKVDILSVSKAFSTSSGFENFNEAVERDINGGKMWVYTRNKACVNEITGATGEIEHFTQIRAFVFTGNKVLKIDLHAKTKAVTLEQTLQYILEKSETFDFSAIQNNY